MHKYYINIYLSLLLALTGCQNNPVIAISPSSAEGKIISGAVLIYVKNNTAVSPDNIQVTAILKANNFARAELMPKKPMTDSAMVYLKWADNQWQVIALGTRFETGFYQQQHIPKLLWAS